MKLWLHVFKRAIEWIPIAVKFDHGEEFTVIAPIVTLPCNVTLHPNILFVNLLLSLCAMRWPSFIASHDKLETLNCVPADRYL